VHIETLFNTAEFKRFHFPGTIVWGRNARTCVAKLLADRASVGLFIDVFFQTHDFVQSLMASLGSRLRFTEICATVPKAQSIKALSARVAMPDAVLSIGGGSTADAAKALIAQWLYDDFDGVGMGARRGLSSRPDRKRPLLISMPTTAGTGADASRYYVTYDAKTNGKVHGKSWQLIADWIVLDPSLLLDSPRTLLVASAFDAFIHFFESFLCRSERSWFGDMLSLDGITRILPALDRILGGSIDEEHFLELLYAATIGGMAISNIRTGNIHEAAGALLELSALTHPETLMVFFLPAYRQYRRAIAEREALLMRRLGSDAPQLGLTNFESVIDWWDRAFESVGLAQRISAGMAALDVPATDLKERIFRRVRDDRVWCTKESPVPLDDQMILSFVDDALAPYGYATN
jgi:alcohol dehydrogenase class IV